MFYGLARLGNPAIENGGVNGVNPSNMDNGTVIASHQNTRVSLCLTSPAVCKDTDEPRTEEEHRTGFGNRFNGIGRLNIQCPAEQRTPVAVNTVGNREYPVTLHITTAEQSCKRADGG